MVVSPSVGTARRLIARSGAACASYCSMAIKNNDAVCLPTIDASVTVIADRDAVKVRMGTKNDPLRMKLSNRSHEDSAPCV